MVLMLPFKYLGKPLWGKKRIDLGEQIFYLSFVWSSELMLVYSVVCLLLVVVLDVTVPLKAESVIKTLQKHDFFLQYTLLFQPGE